MPRFFAMNQKHFSMAAEVALILLITLTLSARLQAQGPALTTISDTVYRADGSAASGTVIISWPSFQTAEGDPVAAGNLSVTIGPLGAFSAQLVPNVGASPAGTYYVVVLQLDDGTVRTEYWAVPATSPTNIAAVLTTPGTGLGNLAVTQGYVDAAVANRALDAAVVHLAGTYAMWRRDLGEFERVNVLGTQTVMEAALAAGTPRAINVSTVAVYGRGSGKRGVGSLCLQSRRQHDRSVDAARRSELTQPGRRPALR